MLCSRAINMHKWLDVHEAIWQTYYKKSISPLFNQRFNPIELDVHGDPVLTLRGNITKWVLSQTAVTAITSDRRWERDKPSSWGTRAGLMESGFSGGLWLCGEMGSTAPGALGNLSEGEAGGCQPPAVLSNSAATAAAVAINLWCSLLKRWIYFSQINSR